MLEDAEPCVHTWIYAVVNRSLTVEIVEVEITVVVVLVTVEVVTILIT
jgi:hypothetical protein